MTHVPQDASAAGPAANMAPKQDGAPETDRELVRMCQNGTQSAFEELVRRHQQRVFRLVGRILRRSEDVEDIAQVVFLKTYLSLRKFDQRAAFSTWLYRITVNECWDYLRKKKTRPLVYESDLSEEQISRLDGIVSMERPPEDPGDLLEARDALEQVLEKLPQQDRDLLLLKEGEGFSVQELAEMLGVNINTVKVRLFRARGKIMEVYRRQKLRSKQQGIAPAQAERK
jgi:RNA polymerase sigma-70 factor, ECF subfamily